jgi:hypothetical protein
MSSQIRNRLILGGLAVGTDIAVKADMNTVKIAKVNGKWAILVNGQMVEGGFFHREAAITAAKGYSK